MRVRDLLEAMEDGEFVAIMRRGDAVYSGRAKYVGKHLVDYKVSKITISHSESHATVIYID